MADNLTTQSATPATIPASSVIATDDSGGAHYQIVELADATTPTQRLAIDSSGRITVTGSLAIGETISRIQVTPTISTSAYAVKDAVGGLLTFANAAASSGGSLRVDSLVVVDKAQQKSDLDLVLFSTSITAPTDNAAFDPTDAELLNHVGVVPVLGGDYADFNDNSAATVTAFPLYCTLAATSLYGVLVARGTPTYVSTSDIVVTIQVTRF